MMEEIRELKQKNHDRFKLQVTGENGTPVYGWLYLDDLVKRAVESGRLPVDTPNLLVRCTLVDSCWIPWRKFENDMEIRLGGVVLLRHHRAKVPTRQNFYLDEKFFTMYYDNRAPIYEIDGELGPRRSGEHNRDSPDNSNLENLVMSREARVTRVVFDITDIEELIRPYLMEPDGRQIRSHGNHNAFLFNVL